MENPMTWCAAASFINQNLNHSADTLWQKLVEENLVNPSSAAEGTFQDALTEWQALPVGFCGLSAGTTVANKLRQADALTEKGQVV